MAVGLGLLKIAGGDVFIDFGCQPSKRSAFLKALYYFYLHLIYCFKGVVAFWGSGRLSMTFPASWMNLKVMGKMPLDRPSGEFAIPGARRVGELGGGEGVHEGIIQVDMEKQVISHGKAQLRGVAKEWDRLHHFFVWFLTFFFWQTKKNATSVHTGLLKHQEHQESSIFLNICFTY